jgi:hypothetical protein
MSPQSDYVILGRTTLRYGTPDLTTLQVVCAAFGRTVRLTARQPELAVWYVSGIKRGLCQYRAQRDYPLRYTLTVCLPLGRFVRVPFDSLATIASPRPMVLAWLDPSALHLYRRRRWKISALVAAPYCNRHT